MTPAASRARGCRWHCCGAEAMPYAAAAAPTLPKVVKDMRIRLPSACMHAMVCEGHTSAVAAACKQDTCLQWQYKQVGKQHIPYTLGECTTTSCSKHTTTHPRPFLTATCTASCHKAPAARATAPSYVRDCNLCHTAARTPCLAESTVVGRCLLGVWQRAGRGGLRSPPAHVTYTPF
jgi:hypothetical protein